MVSETVLARLKTELQEAASKIVTVAELSEYAERFPSEKARKIILEALDYLSESKVINGRRDGKKIWEHVNIGYGPRLKKNDSLPPRPSPPWEENPPVRNIIIAIQMYTEDWAKKHKLPYWERMMHKKSFGVEDPKDLVLEFTYMLSDALRKRM